MIDLPIQHPCWVLAQDTKEKRQMIERRPIRKACWDMRDKPDKLERRREKASLRVIKP